ncbi:hypothetical protein OJO68_25460 [Escherichia coli]|nr:hypothetical protein [Escherichia coli]MCW3190777.1 hypothetical protein [Escherichia coli]
MNKRKNEMPDDRQRITEQDASSSGDEAGDRKGWCKKSRSHHGTAGETDKSKLALRSGVLFFWQENCSAVALSLPWGVT